MVRWFYLLSLLIGLVGACSPVENVINEPDGLADSVDAGGTTSGVQLCPVEAAELVWPAMPESPEPCEPLFANFALPQIGAAEGAIELQPSAPLQPLGIPEQVSISVRLAPGGGLDQAAAGTLKAEVDAGGEVLSITPLGKGRASLRVRLDTPGAHTLKVSLEGDPRFGSVGLWGFKSQLPIVEIFVDPPDFKKVLAKFKDKLWIPALARIEGQKASGKLRLHGGSSKEHPKKSLRLKLDSPGADGRQTMILRAEWSDRTLLRYWLGLQVFAAATADLALTHSRFVHLRLNDRFHGVMLHVERIDSDFLVARGMSTQGSLYEADPPFTMSTPGGNLTPLDDPADYRVVYQQHAGKLDYDDLIALIEFALKWPDEKFISSIERVLPVEETLRYLAVMAVIQNQDHIKKNYYLYRDLKSPDCRWHHVPWDLDISFGRLWTPENDILDDQIFVDGDPFAGEYMGHSFYNGLVERLLSVPQWRARYGELVSKIAQEVMTPEFVEPRIGSAICRMQADLLADTSKRSSNDDFIKRVDELSAFITGRRVWLKTAMKAL